MNTNLIGVVFAILSTNHHHSEVVVMPCAHCKIAHHGQANDFFVVTGTNWVNVRQNGKIDAVELEAIAPKTNSIGHLIDNPMTYLYQQKPGLITIK